MRKVVFKSIFLAFAIVPMLALVLWLNSCNDKSINGDNNETTTSTTDANNQSQITPCKHDNPSQIIIVEAVAPTCQRTGLTGGMQCKLCGTMVLPQTIVPSLNHDESDWIVDRKTTISEAGLRHTECTTCGKMLRQEICQGTLGLNYVENNGTYTVSGSSIIDNETEIIIPATYNGMPVISIGNSAFENCNNLISITIPNRVTSIGDSAFKNCQNLMSITLPNSIWSIGDCAFQNCSSLTNLTIPDNVRSIGYGVFYNCSSLTSFTIPDNVTSIGQYAFQNCSSLTSITIPKSVTSIGFSAFYNCSNLTSITFEGTVAEWNSILFGTWWYRGTPAIKLVCSNGVFRLE